MEDRRLISLARWSKRLEKRHRKLMQKIHALDAEYQAFFDEYKKVVPELDKIEADQANMRLDDLKNTFELDL